MYHAILFLPLIGALFAGLFGRFVGYRACEIVTISLMFVAAFLSWIAFYQVAIQGEDVRISLIGFMHSGAFETYWSIRIDTLTAVMLVVVNTVSSVVHLYSVGYMDEDPHKERFFAYLSLFTFAMLALVTSDDLVQLFFGWEGVGLASYLLIGFWYKKPSANAAAIKAFVVNRVGDFGFLLGIFTIFYVFGAVQYDTIFAAAPDQVGKTITFLSWEVPALELMCFLLFMGAMGKSAQFLLHTWLPDAMEGPTPVSALIHAATMVTAGVFMVARMSPLFDLAPYALAFVAFIGATSAFFAATAAVVQTDIKRVIAYSTCSQLGYMFAAEGVGAYGAGIFHLFTHACFKALLFLCAGAVIHTLADNQDMRRMGGLRKIIPFTWVMMLIGSLALTAFPLTSGFVSKDFIIETTWFDHTAVGQYTYWMVLIAAFLTSLYTWRLMFMTFEGNFRGPKDVKAHAHEPPWTMGVPLMVLAAGALFAGLGFRHLFIGADQASFWRDSIVLPHGGHHDVPFWLVLSPTIAMTLGFLIAWYCYMWRPLVPFGLLKRFPATNQFFFHAWYFDALYDRIFVRPAKWLGNFLWKVGDGKIIDGLGPNGVAARVLDITRGVVKLQTGYIYHYAFIMLIGVALLITYFIVTGGALKP
ncbi:NADH-quinone oxidoreductase subunit L [Methyloceanibacter sp. wino2]|uniref:NADH-quinone oxidoreductase subunit L n=1 Tax=Methyloceanibacter sp. wino2 TaxID=2170729 RepID=UPI000D3E792F|nr:NADH-quinone oxidoreductase subunit L [Methyloceanibacter sp. wino2]